VTKAASTTAAPLPIRSLGEGADAGVRLSFSTNRSDDADAWRPLRVTVEARDSVSTAITGDSVVSRSG
jgi:hypothetical protein